MANFSAADVKRLRELSGAGMMDCKNALPRPTATSNAAIEILRKKGVKDAGKRADRTAANGLVTAELDGNSAGVLVELNCETDFVAKNEQFQELAAKIAKAALANKVADRLALLDHRGRTRARPSSSSSRRPAPRSRRRSSSAATPGSRAAT